MTYKFLGANTASVVGLALAASGFVGTAFAGPNRVTLKANVATQEVVGYDANCPIGFGGKTTGTGVASHLGAVNLVATDCIAPGASSYAFSRGMLTLYAANGDTLTATYDGTLTGSPQSPTPASLSGNFSVTGGTGRFSGASGSGFLQGSENLSTGQGQFFLTGEISY